MKQFIATGLKRALALTALLCGGCQVSFNDDSPDLPRLTIQAKGAFVSLSWWYPPGNATGFVLERRAAAGAFEDLKTLGGQSTSAELGLGPADPAGTLEFRIRAQPSGSESNIVRATHQAGPPAVLSVVRVADGFQVTFAEYPLDTVPMPETTDELVLSRRAVTEDKREYDWRELTRAHQSINTWLDSSLDGWGDGAHYQYRSVVYGSGGPAQVVFADTAAAPYAAPVIKSATLYGGVATLDINSPSNYASTLEVTRKGPADPAARVIATVVPADHAVSVDDPALTPGLYDYAATAHGSAPASAAGHALMVVPPPGLAASIIQLPQGLEVARTAAGGFALLADFKDSPNSPARPALLAPGTPGYGDYFSDTLPASYGDPLSILLDSAGYLHAVYRFDGSSTAYLQHDYQVWSYFQTETIAFTIDSHAVASGLGADGTLHAAWGLSGSVVVGRRLNASWFSEPLPSPFAPEEAMLITGDRSGAPHVVLSQSGTHAWRDGAGWHGDNIPRPSDPAAAVHPLQLLSAGGRLVLIARVSGGSGASLTVADWTSAGWSVTDSIPEPQRAFVDPAPCRAALSGDGQRLAVATDWGALYLYAAGANRQLQWPKNPAPSRPTAFAVGLDASGKAWVLDYIKDRSTPAQVNRRESAVLYQEP